MTRLLSCRCGRTLVHLLAFALLSSSYAQTIIFAGTTAAPTTTPKPQTTTIGCRCVPTGTCVSASKTNFDIRIVNQGPAGCSVGQEWCCGESSTPTGITNQACGKRKITNSSAQPIGTAKYGAYPWQAALLTTDNAYIGSGVLISPNYILTAAHKVAPYPNRNFIVRLGEWDAQKTNEPHPYQDYAPARVTTHPSYNAQNLWNDIAIVKLDRSVPVSTSPNINTACIGQSPPASGTRCWVSGWGKNAFGADGTYQSIMKEVDVPMVDQASCETRLRATRLGQFFKLDYMSFLCAGGESGKDACTGDGGAPLVCETSGGQWQVIGLVAWGIGCAGTGVPGVYANVPNYRAWIAQETGVVAS